MEVVVWICSIAVLLVATAYATIGALLLVAKYRRDHVPSRTPDVAHGAPIADLRYRTP